jgi:cation-transporting ATPase E
VTVFGVVAYAYAVVGVPAAQVQTTAVITLTLTALWVLVVLARPLTRATTAILIGAYAGLIVVLSLPLFTDFLELGMPPLHLVLVAIGASVAASLLLEVVHRSIRH